MATSIDDPSELVFDHRFDLEVDYKHILTDNQGRFPEVLRGNPALARNVIGKAIRQMKARLKRNLQRSWHGDDSGAWLSDYVSNCKLVSVLFEICLIMGLKWRDNLAT